MFTMMSFLFSFALVGCLALCDAAKTLSLPMNKLSTAEFLAQHRAMLANKKGKAKMGDTGSVTVKDYSNAQVLQDSAMLY